MVASDAQQPKTRGLDYKISIWAATFSQWQKLFGTGISAIDQEYSVIDTQVVMKRSQAKWLVIYICM